DPDDADLAEALDPQRIAVVRLVDEDDLDIMHVSMHRHVIFRDIGIHDAAEPVIDRRFLMQRHADSPDYATEDLAARRLHVQDASSRDGGDNASDADPAQLLVHVHFGEDG